MANKSGEITGDKSAGQKCQEKASEKSVGKQAKKQAMKNKQRKQAIKRSLLMVIICFLSFVYSRLYQYGRTFWFTTLLTHVILQCRWTKKAMWFRFELGQKAPNRDMFLIHYWGMVNVDKLVQMEFGEIKNQKMGNYSIPLY